MDFQSEMRLRRLKLMGMAMSASAAMTMAWIPTPKEPLNALNAGAAVHVIILAYCIRR